MSPMSDGHSAKGKLLHRGAWQVQGVPAGGFLSLLPSVDDWRCARDSSAPGRGVLQASDTQWSAGIWHLVGGWRVGQAGGGRSGTLLA